MYVFPSSFHMSPPGRCLRSQPSARSLPAKTRPANNTDQIASIVRQSQCVRSCFRTQTRPAEVRSANKLVKIEWFVRRFRNLAASKVRKIKYLFASAPPDFRFSRLFGASQASISFILLNLFAYLTFWLVGAGQTPDTEATGRRRSMSKASRVLFLSVCPPAADKDLFSVRIALSAMTESPCG